MKINKRGDPQFSALTEILDSNVFFSGFKGRAGERIDRNKMEDGSGTAEATNHTAGGHHILIWFYCTVLHVQILYNFL